MAEDISQSVTFLVTTIERPACLQRLIHSIRAFHPQAPILVVDQAKDDRTVEAFCHSETVGYHRLGFDVGLSAARNAGLDRVATPYFVLCEDDFVITETLDLATAATFLADHADVLMVGGDLDEPHRPQHVRDSILFHKPRNIAIDETARGLILVSAIFANSPVETIGTHRFRVCDVVANWGLCASDRFRANAIRWDERFKIGGEHLDFFLAVKTRQPALRVVFWDEFRCLHAPERDETYKRLRYRLDWTADFRAKWCLDFQYNVGGVLRQFDETFETGRVPDPSRQATKTRVASLQAALDRSREANARLRTRGNMARTGRASLGITSPAPPATSMMAAEAAPPTDLAAALSKYRRYFDRAEGPSPFRRLGPKLLLAATSRSGSTLACRKLAAFGLGIDEFLQPKQLAGSKTPAHRDFFSFVGRLANRYAPHDAFGVKGTFQILAPLFDCGEFPQYLDQWSFVFTRRRNLVAQAVSLVIAEQTGAWRSDMAARVAPEALNYNREAIAKTISNINLINDRWSRFFNSFGIDALEIWYEDLVAEPDAAVTSIARHAGLMARPGFTEETFFPGAPLQQQATEVNARWEASYRSSPVILAALPATPAVISSSAQPRTHLLHVPKTGGTALKVAFKSAAAEIVLHGHRTRFADIAPGDKVIIVVRHPLTRYVSAFWSRFRQGRPRYEVPWSSAETKAFEQFATPNVLAEALFNPLTADAATQAMRSIAHVNRMLSHWISHDELEERRDDILYLARQDVLAQDFRRLKRLLDIPTSAELPQDDVEAHRMPASLDSTLSESATANLRRWYRDDLALFHKCSALRRDIVAGFASRPSLSA